METSKKYKILFFGTPNFAAIILEKLARSLDFVENSRFHRNWSILAVVTAPDKPVGRKQILTPPPVKVLAQKLSIPVLQPEKIENCKLEIENLKPDLIIVAAYGQIIPQNILVIPKYGCLNIHPSLLPKYRGASPIQATILSGDKKTGVTIMLMDEKMDHGPILAQRELEIPNFKFSPYGRPPEGRQISNKFQNSKSQITYEELSKRLAILGAELLIETLPKWLAGKIKPISQDHSKATFTKQIRKKDGRIDWTKSAEYIERMVRAYWPWPGAYTSIKQLNNLTRLPARQANKQLKIIKAEANTKYKIQNTKYRPGTVFLAKNKQLAVGCGEGYLILEELQLEGKRKMTAQEFLNGHPEIINTTLV